MSNLPGFLQRVKEENNMEEKRESWGVFRRAFVTDG
jgi:hypothetical protein